MNEHHYIQTESQLWTVGTGDPGRLIDTKDGIYRYSNGGNFNSESDHDTPEKAAARVAYLNGKNVNTEPYRMLLDFDTTCKKCGEPMVWITTGNAYLPSFHYCGCSYPTFELFQDGVGDVPSFARSGA